MKVTKKQVYHFIETERANLIAKRTKPLQDEIYEKKTNITNDIMIKSGVDGDDFEKAVSTVIKATTELRDNLDFHDYDLGTTVRKLESLKKGNDSILSRVNYRLHADVAKLEREVSDTRTKLNEEFDKVRELAKAARTGVEAARILDKIGFDTSKLTKRNEIVDADINKSLLGIDKK